MNMVLSSVNQNNEVKYLAYIVSKCYNPCGDIVTDGFNNCNTSVIFKWECFYIYQIRQLNICILGS